MTRKRKTTVGRIADNALAFTAGEDSVLDLRLVRADCIGSAAHVTMLSRIPIKPRLFSDRERKAVVLELARIARDAERGRFRISLEDQDVHLAVERRLTDRLGDLGKRIHTGRSRNDQAALDIRLYAREQLLNAIGESARLAEALIRMGRRYALVPMVGRSHMQPAMPSSVGLWATSFAESLSDDLALLRCAYDLNNRNPLGAAAGFGVPLPIDRALTTRLLGFRQPVHNVIHANNARGKNESVILSALAQVMVTLSRLAQDLMIYSMPEFDFFRLPPEYCTGSSIMPQKNNPDVLELVRARAAVVSSCLFRVLAVIKGLPGGYNRDVQETKGPFMEGMDSARGCLRILLPVIQGLEVRRAPLLRAFTPGVFATDHALNLVADGMPFRDAYCHVKEHLAELENMDPMQALMAKRHLGAPAGLDFALLARPAREAARFAARERRRCEILYTRLFGEASPFPRSGSISGA